jgi:3-oxoacyl-[acyl-carrier protein] reductase
MSASDLTGKVAIVTGGSKGFGACPCLVLAKAGASVVLNYSSDAAAANEVVAKIGSDRALAIKGDAGSIVSFEDLVKQTVDKFGKIDIVIPNAGVLPMTNLETTTEELFDKCFALNVKGTYFLVQRAAPYMSAGSRVIFLSTTLNTASTVSPNYLLYSSSKGAIDQMVRDMSKELAAKGIMVNSVAPGPTATELFLREKPEQMLKAMVGANPHGRLGQPEDIAGVVLVLSGTGSH